MKTYEIIPPSEYYNAKASYVNLFSKWKNTFTKSKIKIACLNNAEYTQIILESPNPH